MARKAASAIGPSWPTKVTTQRLCVGSLCTSSRLTPSTLRTASAICSITSGRRPSLKLGMHSMRVTRGLRLLG